VFRRPGCPASPPRQGAHNVGGVRELTAASQLPAGELFVLVAGWPGSGKSTLAAALAAEMRLPLLAKDEIKEALMDGLGRLQTVAESQRLGRATVLAVLRVARHCPGAVLASTWFDYAIPIANAAGPARRGALPLGQCYGVRAAPPCRTSVPALRCPLPVPATGVVSVSGAVSVPDAVSPASAGSVAFDAPAFRRLRTAAAKAATAAAAEAPASTRRLRRRG